jgi:hypothetical protein
MRPVGCWNRLARAAGDQHVLVHALVFRRDDPDAAFVQQAADDVGIRAFDDLDDRAFRTAAAVRADHLGQHAVAMQHFLHFLVVQEEIGTGFLGDHEAEAVAVRGDAAGDEATAVGQRINAVVAGVDLAVALHGVQAASQDFLGGRLDLQGTGESGRVEWGTGIAEDAEDFLAARNSMSRLLQIGFLNSSIVAPERPAPWLD